VGDGGDGLGDVVEDDHAVVEGEAEVRQAAVVRRRVGQALDVADRVVAGVADQAAGESRECGVAAVGAAGEQFAQVGQRVGRGELVGRPGTPRVTVAIESGRDRFPSPLRLNLLPRACRAVA